MLGTALFVRAHSVSISLDRRNLYFWTIFTKQNALKEKSMARQFGTTIISFLLSWDIKLTVRKREGAEVENKKECAREF